MPSQNGGSTSLLLLLSLFLVVVGADLQHRFIRGPEPLVAPPGDKTKFHCATSVPAERVVWRRGNETLHVLSGPEVEIRVSNATAGIYRCIADFGAVALLSLPARLDVATPPRFSNVILRHVNVTAGSSVLLRCPTPSSIPPALLQILRNSEPVQGSITPTGSVLLTNITSADRGDYTCKASNPFTNESEESQVFVRLSVIPASGHLTPQFTVKPPPQTSVQVGNSVTLECFVSGASVEWVKYGGVMPPGRTLYQQWGVTLVSVGRSDAGTYICRSHGVGEVVTELQVTELPHIVISPQDTNVTEGREAKLECEAEGHPSPNIYWTFNGEMVVPDTIGLHIVDGGLYVKDALKSHAGLYQCFAENIVGAEFAGATLGVLPTQVTARSGVAIGESGPTTSPTQTSRKGNSKGKKHRGNANMTLPSKPTILRLSNEAVMVQWSVAPNNGLPILFFKVQYGEVGGKEKEIRWLTIEEDIAPHIFSYEVTGLTAGKTYRFRIAAVYSNNDNKHGPKSARFFLQATPSEQKPHSPPLLVHTEPFLSSAIRIMWEYPHIPGNTVEGYFVHYRPSTTAGDYTKVTVLGESTREHIVTHLLPDTAYDLKLQAFNMAGTSDFSAIHSQRTLPSPVTPAPGINGGNEVEPKRDIPDSGEDKKDGGGDGGISLSLVVGAAVGAILVLLMIGAAIIVCRGRSRPARNHTTENAIEENNFQFHEDGAPRNGYRSGGRVTVTTNPLAEATTRVKLMETSSVDSHHNNNRLDESNAPPGSRRWSQQGQRWNGEAENFL